MPVLPILLGWLVVASDAPASPSPSPGYVPNGSIAELYDIGRLALLRDPRLRMVSIRPAETPREENGRTILAQLDGPGIIQRLYFTHRAGDRPGILARKDGHIRITLDHRAEPALDVPLEDLFNGRHPRFPHPMANEGAGGFVSYIPIAFRDGCRVEVDGNGLREYQVDVLKLPSAEGVTTFNATPTKDDREELSQARQLWLDPDNLFTRRAELRKVAILDPDVADFHVESGKRTLQRFILPAGPRTIRSLEVFPDPDTKEAWRAARLRLVWDGDDPKGAGVELPLGFFFVEADGVLQHRSLLVGHDGPRWWNRFPMPYRRQALLELESDEPLKGGFRVKSVAGAAPGAGYLRASYRESRGGWSEGGFDWLNERGRGHYAGTFVIAEGRTTPARCLSWGGDRFVIDGEPLGRGLGLEELFNGGWAGAEGRLERAETYPVSGFPIVRRDHEGTRVAAYRWQPTDPIPFARSLAAGVDQPDVHSSPAALRVAGFWYSERPGPVRAGD